jgi:hypothetical protein
MKIERDVDIQPAKLPTFYYLLCKTKQLLEPMWAGLGAVESLLLKGAVASQPIRHPVYITGMARTGTTITLEMLSRHPDVATHRYRDMAQPYLPFVWNALFDLFDRLPLPAETPRERVCQDGIFVTRDSPEAVEEAIWMRFFPALHDEARSAVLDCAAHHPAFENYYRATLAKLLLARKRSRYVTKADDVVTRLAYLVRLFPGARFIVTVREPAAHFASWIKMHELYLRMQRQDRRWFSLIRFIGHHAFGLDQRFVHAGDSERIREIRRAWDSGDQARAFGLYWSSIYGHVLDLAERDPLVGEAVMFVRHEDLCAAPRDTIDRILAHAKLDAGSFQEVRERYASTLTQPGYYRATLDAVERLALTTATRDVAARLGYF